MRSSKGRELKVVLIHPGNDFDVSVVQTKNEVDRIIWTCVDRINNRTPSLDTIKMQVYFTLNYAARDEFLQEHSQALNSRLKPLVNQILEMKPRLKDEFNELYQQIVLSVMLWAGLTVANDLYSVKETTTALQSVFPRSEMGCFLALDKRNKERQLEELRYIITGIILYNWKCGKGGKGIEHLPATLKRLIPQFNTVLEEELKKYQKIATTSLAYLEQIPESNLDYSDRELIWEASVNARQAIAYIRVIQEDVSNSNKQIEALEKNFEDKIDYLQSTVKSKVAIPTGHVYPLFIHIAHIWKSLQNENVLLCLLRNIVYNMSTYTDGSKTMIMDVDIIQKFAGQVTVVTDEDRCTKAADTTLYALPVGTYLEVKVLSQAEITKLNDIKIEYDEFCPWSLVTNQLLVPGNSSEIVLFYANKYYTFISNDGAHFFAKRPDWFIGKVKEMAKSMPELIQLLHMQSQIYPPKKTEMKTEKTATLMVNTCESEIQTELHPIPRHINPNYEWNEWSMRRKGIELADLRKKTTHSSQTNESHFRRENFSQVYLPKEKNCQTVKHTASNTLLESHFLGGLQGYRYGKPGNYQYLDLTEEK
uniref:Cilia- and flagella-associated protein 206 n=1 Tax=Strigamia maritima TaxID=126957 RepID=T1IIW0_STRMM